MAISSDFRHIFIQFRDCSSPVMHKVTLCRVKLESSKSVDCRHFECISAEIDLRHSVYVYTAGLIYKYLAYDNATYSQKHTFCL